MKVITLNVNGIRSAERKGVYRWLAAQKADVICLQEVKAQEPDLAGGPFDPHAGRVVATNGAIHQELIVELARARRPANEEPR